jgi:hypothetical protein
VYGTVDNPVFRDRTVDNPGIRDRTVDNPGIRDRTVDSPGIRGRTLICTADSLLAQICNCAPGLGSCENFTFKTNLALENKEPTYIMFIFRVTFKRVT